MGMRSGSCGILGWEKSKSGGGGGAVDYYEDEQQQEEEEEECDVVLGLGMQLDENTSDATPSSSSSSVFPSRKAASAHHPQPHPYHHYLSGDHVGGGSAYGGNPTSSNLLLNQVSHMGLGGPRESTPVIRSPDCFPSGGTSSTKTTESLHLLHHPLTTSGKMGASGNVRVPFTAAQWQELERQNTILKYMMASVPVPSQLLLPISSTPKSYSNVVLPSRAGGDPEPWRCRRTDGKKWRCSRDVAPHQKYCERHSHKNRPRSRKLVELPPAAAAAPADYLLNPAAKSKTKRSVAMQPQQQHQQPPLVDSRQALSSHFITTFDQDSPAWFASSQPFDQPRYLDWFMKGETIPDLDWHPHQHQVDATVFHRKDSNISSSDIDLFQRKQGSQYSTAIPQDCGLLLMEGVVDPSHGQQTRRFIDAWSDVDDGGGNRAISSYNPSPGKDFDPPTSSLSLTMCGGEGEDYSLGNQRMGEKPHWMSGAMGHQGSWMGSQPGGPLAEALCLGSIGGGTGCVRYQSSSRGCSSTTTTTTSSRRSSKDEGQEELNFIG